MGGNKRWTADELTYLSKNYGYSSIEDLSKYLTRSKASIHKKASDLGISFSKVELIPSIISDLNLV